MRLFIFTLLALATGCGNSNKETPYINPKTLHLATDSVNTLKTDETSVLNCDSIYKTKGLRIALTPVRNGTADDNSRTFLFKFLLDRQGILSELFKDTIESTVQKVKFADFNGDQTKDILIQNSSDVRSNWTYNLFLFDEKKIELKKINGFEEIKNPSYLSGLDIISNYVNSGTNWTSFYKIQSDTILDLGIPIEDDSDEGSYQRKYEKALSELKKRKKNNH